VAKKEQAARGQYGEVVARLQQIVESLEGGQLSLEESLERFAEGVRLVRQGEGILAEAEKRIEQLLSEDGRTAALSLPEEPPPPRPASKRGPAARALDDDADVPF
jgi:exodeoxyribonuclease VII small subunit